VNQPYTDSLYSMCQISCPFSFAHVIPKNLPKSEALCNILQQTVLWRGVASPMPNPQLEDHPLSAVHNCLFHIFAEAFSSICNLRMQHAVVTRDPFNIALIYLQGQKHFFTHVRKCHCLFSYAGESYETVKTYI
jgi:hypothetical protein